MMPSDYERNFQAILKINLTVLTFILLLDIYTSEDIRYVRYLMRTLVMKLPVAARVFQSSSNDLKSQ